MANGVSLLLFEFQEGAIEQSQKDEKSFPVLDLYIDFTSNPGRVCKWCPGTFFLFSVAVKKLYKTCKEREEQKRKPGL